MGGTSLPRCLVGACVVALLLAACSGGEEPATTATTGATDAPTALSPLHAEQGPARIVDGDGRQVLLRGVNLNGLGDYYQDDPELDPTFAFDDGDFAEMATLGFDVVRLLVHWSRLEAEPGQVDETYLDDIARAVDQAEAHGLYTVIDLHQDAWGKFIATPADETCPAGLQPALGWDGAPEWATLTDGASTCNNGTREAAPAVVAAWNNFYDDTDGIQGHFLDVWTALAGRFAADPAVAGYDVLNEPGFGPGLAGTNEELSALYERAVDAIRAGEDDAGEEGFPHLVFFEPAAIWSGLGRVDVPAPFSDDPNLVFAPHLYAESLTASNITIAEGFTAAAEAATTYGTTFWSGEYGWFGDPDEQADQVSEYARQEDAHLVGGAWWQWRQACGDPHSVGEPGGTPAALLVHLHSTRCPEGEDVGLTQPWATTLSRAYPRAAPGVLESITSDPDTGALRVTGQGDGEIDLWVPDRDQGSPQVTGGDATVDEVDGGYRITVAVSGGYDVRVSAAGGR